MDLADLIARVESSDEQHAQRFERLHLGASRPELLARIASINHCSTATADVYAAMSHGLFQIMGFRLYGDPTRDNRNLGMRERLSDYLGSRELQRAYFMKYVERNGINFTVDDLILDAVKRREFARLYNGPDRIEEYSTRILAAIRSTTRTV